MNNSGRKVKRTKKLYGNKRKNKAKSIFAVILTLVIATALIFLGYSIGDPILSFFKNLRNPSSTTAPWTPSVTVTSEQTSDTSTAVTSTEQNQLVNINGYMLSLSDLSNEQSLIMAMNNVKTNNYTSVIVPLKVRGGEIYYESTIEKAKKAGALKSTIPLSKITSIADSSGLNVIAQINVLYDNIAPNADKLIAYQFADGTSSWYDNKPENGGKKWLSPFSEQGKLYIDSIVDEILSADFDAVIYSDISFPAFRNSDLNYIGEIVKSTQRYEVLISTANNSLDKTVNTGKTAYLEIYADKILNNTEEVFRPDLIINNNYIVNYSAGSIGNTVNVNGNDVNIKDLSESEKFKTVFQTIKSKTAADTNLIPLLNKQDFTEEEYSKVMQYLQEIGIKEYFIR